MKRIVALLIVAGMIGHITAYAAFPPISTASWRSEFRKIEIVEEEAAPDEPVLVTDSLATPSDLGMADSSDEVVDDALVPSDEVVDDALVPSDEVVDFTGDVVLDDQDSVVPDTTAYDGEQNDDSLATPSDLDGTERMDSSDEVVDFTGDVEIVEDVDDQDSVVPDTTAYDGEQNDVGGVFVIVAVEDQGEPDELIEDQIETQIEEPITPPDEADDNT